LNEPSSKIKQSFKATHINFLLQSIELYSLKCTNLAIGYGEYLGAKDGFTLVLGGYLVWLFRLSLVWIQLPKTESKATLDFWKWNPNLG
jgi:hypothetical protein